MQQGLIYFGTVQGAYVHTGPVRVVYCWLIVINDYRALRQLAFLSRTQLTAIIELKPFFLDSLCYWVCSDGAYGLSWALLCNGGFLWCSGFYLKWFPCPQGQIYCYTSLQNSTFWPYILFRSYIISHWYSKAVLIYGFSLVIHGFFCMSMTHTEEKSVRKWVAFSDGSRQTRKLLTVCVSVCIMIQLWAEAWFLFLKMSDSWNTGHCVISHLKSFVEILSMCFWY